MSTFVGGPADGVQLTLRSAPRFLRVVFNRRSKRWDALDQHDDTPKSNDNIFLYVRSGEPFVFNVSARGRGASKIRGPVSDANYLHTSEQPDPHTLRDTDAWRAWVQVHSEAFP